MQRKIAKDRVCEAKISEIGAKIHVISGGFVIAFPENRNSFHLSSAIFCATQTSLNLTDPLVGSSHSSMEPGSNFRTQ